MPSPRSVLLVKLSAIGDVLHGIPVAVALRRAFPRAEIGWVVEGRTADLLDGHRAIDRIFRLPRGWAKRGGEWLRLRRELRAFAPDVTIDMQGLCKSAIVTLLSAAPVRVGPAGADAREGSWLATTCRVPSDAAHVVERNLALVSALGVAPGMPSFAMPSWPLPAARMRRFVTALGDGLPPVIVNPGAGWPSKLWAEDRFAAVARRLAQEQGRRTIVVWGGKAEQAAAERIVEASGATLAPPTSLQELAELCRLADLFISSDTGPLHLAAAVGTPCVGLFGPVPATRNGPWGDGHATVEPPPEVRPPWRERKTDSRAMAGIGVDEVVAAAGAVLRQSRRRAAC